MEGGTIKSSSSWARHSSREANTAAEEEAAGDRGSVSKFHVSQQSSATGSISIEECGNEGNFIHLKNSSDKVICELYILFFKVQLCDVIRSDLG